MFGCCDCTQCGAKALNLIWFLSHRDLTQKQQQQRPNNNIK